MLIGRLAVAVVRSLLPQALFTSSMKSFVRRTFFVSLMYPENFLLIAQNFLRSKFYLNKRKYAWRTKVFTLRVNRTLKAENVVSLCGNIFAFAIALH